MNNKLVPKNELRVGTWRGVGVKNFRLQKHSIITVQNNQPNGKLILTLNFRKNAFSVKAESTWVEIGLIALA